MIIYPTLELSNGKCVSLTRGRLEEPVIWHIDPVKTAKSFADLGAEWMHITDIDALSGHGENADLIEQIIRTVGIPVQLGGGFRSQHIIERWIDKGVGRVVVGTMAAYDPDLMKDMARHYPDQLVLAVDIYQGAVMTEGWHTKSAFSPEDFVAAFDDVPLAGVIVTDIDADIEDSDETLGVITRLAGLTRHPVIARGTVRSADDVSRLKYVPNIAGAIIGRALLSKNVSLAEALELAQPTPEPIAKFT